MKRRLGWISPVAAGRAPHTGARTAGSLAGLPERVMLEHLPSVFDQGGVGSCTAQALALAIVALHRRAGYAPETPDRASLYRREREMIGTVGEDSGALISDGVALLEVGWDKELTDPGGTWGERWTRPAPALTPSSPRLVSAEPLDFDVATIATELAAGHPVVVGIQVTDAWMDFVGNTLPEPSGPSVGGHAVCLVGYDLALRAWRVRNSWGEGWRDGGEAWLPFAWTSAPWCGEVFALRAVRHVRGLAVTDAADDLFPPKELEPVPTVSMSTPLDGLADTIERELLRAGPGLVINGGRVPVPGVAVCTWLDDAKRAPRVTDGGRRDADDVIAFVWHTSKGRLCRTLAPDAIPSTHAETLARYQSRTAREVSWHITVDTDGDVLQQADLALWTCWHAGSANGWTVGGELVQREDAPTTLTAPQIRAAADVTDATCAALGIPRRVLVDAAGAPWLGLVKDLASPKIGGRGKTWPGVIAHAHLTTSRGPGDPGPLIFAELISRGYARHVVDGAGHITHGPMP